MYFFCLQEDVNFVLYNTETSEPVWASDTWKSDAVRLCMQEDCNLVMYNEDGEPRWHTNTAKPSCNTCTLSLTDEGKLVLDRDGGEIWNSDISHGMK